METHSLNAVPLSLVSLFALLCASPATAAASQANLPAKAAAATALDKPLKSIPWDQIGANAGTDYQGEGLRVTPTAEGARLHCVFQRLDGEATPEGLWLTSTADGAKGDRFRVMAVAVGREPSSVRSAMSLVTVSQRGQAPSGAACTDGAESWCDMPLLTELETTCLDLPFYKNAAPDGAIACLTQGAQTLACGGTVSVEGKLVRWSRPGLMEEYSVSLDGVRQDFVVTETPAGEG